MFVGALGLVLVFALPGGAYDLVVRQEITLVVWGILAIGLALGLLPRSSPARSTWLLLALLAAYAGWTALSLTWTESSERTLAEVTRALGYLGVMALASFTVDRRTWRAAAAGLGCGAAAICLLALAERLAPAAFPLDQVDLVFHGNRLSFPFGYWNALGAWGTMSSTILLAWSIHDPSRLRRALALALVPACAVTVYLTYSRAGIGGAAVGVAAVLALSRNRLTATVHTVVAVLGGGLAVLAVRSAPEIAQAKGSQGAWAVLGAVLFAGALGGLTAALTASWNLDRLRLPRRVFRPAAAVCALVLVLAAAGFGPRVASHAWHAFRTQNATVGTDPAARLGTLSGTRYNLWKEALQEFRGHPVGGTGAGTFEFWSNRHALDVEFVKDSHSIWFENLGELGAAGLLLTIAVVLSAVWVAVEARRKRGRRASVGASTAFLAAFIVYLVHASVDWMWESTAITVLPFAGIAVIAMRNARKRGHLRWTVRVPLVTLALLAAVVQLPGLLGTYSVRRSQAAARAGETQLALSWARKAVSLQPWAASAYEQRGLVFEAMRQYSSAAADLRSATEHERTNFDHWLVLARVETERGHFNVAARDFDEAHRLRPKAEVFQVASTFSTK